MKVTITRIERDAFKEAARLEKAKRHPGRGILTRSLLRSTVKPRSLVLLRFSLRQSFRGRNNVIKRRQLRKKSLKERRRRDLKKIERD